MVSQFQRYNEAIAREQQVSKIEQEIRPQVEQQVRQVEQSESQFSKDLRQAVIANQGIDLRRASQTKQEFSQLKSQARQPLTQIAQERQKIKQLKSGVKSQEQLESQGYKKEIRGDKVIYYKEDTYNRKKGDKRTFREEEYIFSQETGKPISIIERDDYRKGDRRKVDEESIVRFDSEGRVSTVEEFDEGKRTERTSYAFKADGSTIVSTRDYEKERKLKEKQSQKPQQVQIEATLSGGLGASQETEVIKTTKGGVTRTSTIVRTKQTPTRKARTTKVLQATAKLDIETQISQNVLTNLGGGIPGVNQGTDISNIPTQDIFLRTQASGGSISKQASKVDIDKALEYKEAGTVQKFFLKDYDKLSVEERRKFDESQGTDTEFLLKEIGYGAVSGAQSAGRFARELVTSPISTTAKTIETIPKIPGAIIKKSQTSPGGLFGEILFDVTSGTLGATAIKRAKGARQTVTQDEITGIRTRTIDGKIETQARGGFIVESGLVRRTRQDFTFESIGTLEKVKDYGVPGETVSTTQKITQERVDLLGDKPQTPRKVKPQTTSRELATPEILAEVKPGKGTKKTPETGDVKEVFRGEIETQIRDASGKVVKTQKVPAELVREGQKQTLYVDGKPFDVRSKQIATRESAAIEGDVSMREGEFGLDLKRQTTETITTEIGTGKKTRTLTQQIETPQGVSGGGTFRDPETKLLGEERINLLGDKPQTPIELAPSKQGMLTDPIVSAKKSNGSTRTSSVDPTKSKGKLFEGVSLPLREQPLTVSKGKTPDIIEGEVTGERLTPKELGVETLQISEERIARLESPIAQEERQVAEVFGQDFVDKAKSKQTTKAIDPFDQSGMFDQAQVEMVQVFKQKTETKQTLKSDIEPIKSKPLSSKQETVQEMIFEQKPQRTSETKSTKVEDISLDISVAKDISGIGIKSKGTTPGILPTFAESQMFEQGELFGTATAQGQGVAQIQGSDVAQAIDQGFSSAQAIQMDQGVAQAIDQAVAQETIQGQQVLRPVVPPIIPPGFTPGIAPPPPDIRDPSEDDPFKKGKKKTREQQGEFAGSLTGLFQGLEIEKAPKDQRTTGLSKRAVIKGRNF